MKDFSVNVAELLSSSSTVVSDLIAKRSAKAPAFWEQAAIVARAEGGDAEAQAQLADIQMNLGMGNRDSDGSFAETAEAWARMSADAGSQHGEYSLASILMYRAGLLAGIGFRQQAKEVALEAMDLLSTLADEGMEEAALSVVSASDALAAAGIRIMGDC